MSQESQQHPLETPHPDAPVPNPGAAGGPPGPPHGAGAPAPPYPGSGSSDELSASLEATLHQPRPDPLLGEFQPEKPEAPPVAEAAVDPKPTEAPSAWDLASLVVEAPVPPPPAPGSGSYDAVLPPGVRPVAPSEAATDPPPTSLSEGWPPPHLSPGSVDALTHLPMSPAPPPAVAEPEPEPVAWDKPLAGIDLSAPPSRPTPTARKVEEDDEDEEDEPRRMSLGVVLLASYASAVTIGLIYVVSLLRAQRAAKPAEEPDFLPPAATSADPGRRAGDSRKVEPPPPIPAENLTTLGRPVTLGGLEVTPVGVTSGPVVLRHTLNPSQTQKGGTGALKLRLRLRNVTKDAAFAPLDEAFIRRRAGASDSFIDAGNGRVIPMYYLAVASEWAIEGQEFRDLKPGETLDTVVVSAADALDQTAPEMTWRVRLRTGIDQTDTLGVRFQAADVQRGK